MQQPPQQPIVELSAQADKRIGQVFRTMLLFTLAMVLGPISSYFLSKKYVFEDYFKTASDMSYIYAAGTAVLVVHIILGAFIYLAWKDAMSDQVTAKKKD